MAGLAADYQRFTAEGAEVIAISVDEPGKSSELVNKLKLPFPVLCDTDHKVIDSYDLYNPDGKIAKPAVFVLDKKGIEGVCDLVDHYAADPLQSAKSTGAPKQLAYCDTFRFRSLVVTSRVE